MNCFCVVRRRFVIDATALFSVPHKVDIRKILGLIFLGALLCDRSAQGDMYPSKIYSGGQAVAAIVAGDFDPVHSGTELACLMADGSVVELALSESGWSTNRIFVYRGADVHWPDPRKRVSLDIGDVLPGNPGPEL